MTGDVTGRMYDRLVAAFGTAQVIRDVDDIPLGVDFVEHIEDRLSDCKWCLVIIGDRWASIKDPSTGTPRIKSSNDLVRREVEIALNRKLLVVPVCVRGASEPSIDDLPESLAKLSTRNGVKVRRDPDFGRDMEKLIVALSRYTPLQAGTKPPAVSAAPGIVRPWTPSTAPAAATIDDSAQTDEPASGLIQNVTKLAIGNLLASHELKKRMADAQAHDDADCLDEAITIYRAILDEQPKAHDARAKLARLLRETSRNEDALALIKMVPEADQTGAMLAEKSYILDSLNQMEAAQLCAERAVHKDPNLADAWRALHAHSADKKDQINAA